MNPKTFGSRVAKQFQEQFPELDFKRSLFDDENKEYSISYIIRYNYSYFGMLIIYKHYSIELCLYNPYRSVCAKLPKERIKIKQLIYEALSK